MKKIYLLTLLITILSTTLTAQITDLEKKLKEQSADTIYGWKKGGIVSVSMSQTNLTNWSEGGQNSLSLNGILKSFVNYKAPNRQWDNYLELGYGMLKQGEKEDFMKTDDQIDITSKYGEKAFKNFYYAGLVNAKTQFSNGYNYPNDSTVISDWMAPGYLTVALGLDYNPNKHLSAFLAPVTGKFTYVNSLALSDAGAFGVDPAVTDEFGNILTHGSKVKQEFGGYMRVLYTKADFQTEILKNVGVISKLELFSNYLKNPQNVDINWENLVTLKINKFLMVNFTFNLKYDDDTKTTEKNPATGLEEVHGAKLQMKEILGVGIAYKW